MTFDTPVAYRLSGGTPFAVSILSLYGWIDRIGSWLEPAEHLVHLDNLQDVTDLLDAEGIKYTKHPEYIDTPEKI